jgi:hypothetical protein
MTATWSPEQVERIGRAEELQIAARSADGTLRRWVPIWVVCVGDQVFVRTWYRRDNGWFGHVLDSRRARIAILRVVLRVTRRDCRTSLLMNMDRSYEADRNPSAMATVTLP